MLSYHVIGAAKGIGRWFSEQLSINGHTLYCYDVAIDALDRLHGRGIVKCPVTKEYPYSSYINEFQLGDVVLLAVPQTILPSLKIELLEKIKGVLVVCLTSVQSEPMRLLYEWGLNVAPLGCHPLFGATVASPVGQLAALTKFDSSNSLHRDFDSDIRKLGLIPIHLTPALHDQHMSVVQALTHFCLFTFSMCLSELSANPSTLFDLRTPNFQFLYAFACRVMKIAPTTSGSIQFAPDAKQVRKKFVEIASMLCKEIDEAESINEVSKIIETIQTSFEGAYVEEGAQVAAVGIDSLQRFEHLIHRHLTTKAPFVFRHRGTGDIHVVKIINNNSVEIEYEESKVECDGKYAIGYDEISKNNYKRIGFVFGKPAIESIKKINIVLFGGDELSYFWKNKIINPTLKLNVMNPHELGEEFFETSFPKLISGLHKVDFIKCFRRREETQKVTISITYDPRYDRDSIVKEIQEVTQNYKMSNRVAGGICDLAPGLSH